MLENFWIFWIVLVFWIFCVFWIFWPHSRATTNPLSESICLFCCPHLPSDTTCMTLHMPQICLKFSSTMVRLPCTLSSFPVVFFRSPHGLAPLPYKSQHTKNRSPANGEWYGLRTATTGLLALDPTALDACHSLMHCLVIKWFKWHWNDFWHCILAQLFNCHLGIGVVWFVFVLLSVRFRYVYVGRLV